MKIKAKHKPSADQLVHLPAFADYLLQNKLHQFTEQQIRLGEELNIPLLRFFSTISQDVFFTICLKSITELLTALSQNKAKEQIEINIQRWITNQLPQFKKEDVTAEDITLISLLRKKTFLYFVPDYFDDIETVIEVVEEIDIFLTEYETALLNTYFNLFREKIDEHAHFIETIANTSPGIIYVYDVVNNKEVYTNHSVTDFLGYTQKELTDIGSEFVSQLIHPDDIPVIEENDKGFADIQDGEVRSVKYRIKNKDGEYRWMRAYETVFKRDGNKNVVEKIGIAIDITEQKRTAEQLYKREEELVQTQEQYKQAEAITHIGSYVWNIKTNEIRWSDELYRIYGLEPGEPISYTYLQSFNDKQDTSDISNIIQEAIASQKPFDFYYSIYAKDGTHKILRARGQIVAGSDGTADTIIGTTQDVTEKQRLIEKLKRNDELYRQAEYLAKMGNYTLDLITNKIEWTDQLYKNYDLEPQSEEITLDRFFSFVHPQDKDLVNRSVEQLYQKGSLDSQFRIVTDDGVIKTMRSIAYIVKDADGKPVRVIGTEQDVTEREDLTRKLQKSKSLYTLAEQMGNIGNWSWDLLNNKLEWTDHLYRIYGLEPQSEEITIERFLSFIHPEDKALVESGVDEIFSRKNLDYTFRIITQDGTLKTLRSVAQVQTDENGVPVEVVGTEADVTDKQELISNLQESQKLFKQAQSLAHIGNWSWDIANNKIHWSDELFKIYGLAIQESIDFDTFSSILHPDDRDQMLQTIQTSLQTHKPYDIYHRLLLKDGTVKHVHGRGEVVANEQGEPIKLMGTGQDVTERQVLIEKLQQSDKLYKQAQSLAKLGNFAWEVQTNTVYWSDEVYKIYGIPIGDLVTFEDAFKPILPQHQTKVKEAVKNTIANKKGASVSYAIQTVEGHLKYLNLETDVVLDKEGNVSTIIGTAQDVTERQELIEQLQQSQQLYKQAQSLAHIGNWMWNIQTGEVAWSDELFNIYEVTDNTPLTYDAIVGFIHPDDKEAVLRDLHESVTTGKVYDKIHRIVLPSGKIKTINRRAEVIRDEEGKPFKMVGTTQDVTEQQRIQQELKENQTFIRKIADATPSIIASYNTNSGKYVFVSEGLEKLLGYNAQEALEKGIEFFVSIIHPDDLMLLAEKNAKALEEANSNTGDNSLVIEFTYRMRHKDGQYRWFHTYGTVFDRNAQGQVEHVLNISLDVTEQVEATSKIKDQEHFIQQIADASPTILYLFDVETQQFTYINREIFFVLGYIPEEIYEAENDITQLVYHPEDLHLLPERKESTKRFQQADSMIQYECRLKNKEGEWRWLLVREIAFKTDATGNITQILGAALDINRRKEMEKTLLQNSFMLEQSNASLEEFAYVASHDLKEPLRKISTFGDRLIESNKEKLDDTGRIYLKKIVEASQRMQIMINDLLSISMISGNRSYEPCSLQQILEETLHTLEFKIEQQNAVIEADTLPSLKIIPSQFRQLFQNLVSNSLKFVREGVQPEIRISHTTVLPEQVEQFSLAEAAQYVKLQFVDNGIGFENEYAGKIFAIFQRLHGRSEYEGSGIGLSICKKIVEHHGGCIYAEGEPDKGATFTIILPA